MCLQTLWGISVVLKCCGKEQTSFHQCQIPSERNLWAFFIFVLPDPVFGYTNIPVVAEHYTGRSVNFSFSPRKRQEEILLLLWYFLVGSDQELALIKNCHLNLNSICIMYKSPWRYILQDTRDFNAWLFFF